METKKTGDLTIPVFSEEVSTGTQKVATGRVRVTKHNVPHEETIEQELQSEHADVRRVQINRQVDGPQQVRQEGNTLVVPIVEEVLQVQKIWMLKEELHIQRRSTVEKHEERVVLNREVAAVERVDEAGNVTNETAAAETPVISIPPVAPSQRETTSFLTPKDTPKESSPRRGRGIRPILNRRKGRDDV